MYDVVTPGLDAELLGEILALGAGFGILTLVLFFLVPVACWVFSAMLAAQLARHKGFNALGWFVAGVITGPIALLGAVGLPDRYARPAAPQSHPSVLGTEQPLSAVRPLGEAEVLDGTLRLAGEPDRSGSGRRAGSAPGGAG